MASVAETSTHGHHESVQWNLPGLQVDVTCDTFPLAAPAPTEEGVELHYPPTTLRLDVTSL